MHVMAYAVRASIQPTVLLKHIPQTLTYIAQVDYARQRALEEMKRVLELDNKYKTSRDARVSTLTRLSPAGRPRPSPRRR